MTQISSKINLQIISSEDDRVLFKDQMISLDSMGNLMLADLLHTIQGLGMDLNNNLLISFYSDLEEIYIMAGRDPISEKFVIRREEIDWSQGLLKIRISEAE